MMPCFKPRSLLLLSSSFVPATVLLTAQSIFQAGKDVATHTGSWKVLFTEALHLPRSCTTSDYSKLDSRLACALLLLPRPAEA